MYDPSLGNWHFETFTAARRLGSHHMLECLVTVTFLRPSALKECNTLQWSLKRVAMRMGGDVVILPCRRSLAMLLFLQLFGEFADPFDLPQCKLAIVHCAGHHDPTLIESLWQDIIEKGGLAVPSRTVDEAAL